MCSLTRAAVTKSLPRPGLRQQKHVLAVPEARSQDLGRLLPLRHLSFFADGRLLIVASQVNAQSLASMCPSPYEDTGLTVVGLTLVTAF